MRRKFAKQKRKNALRIGAKIKDEHWVKEPGWQRKYCSYAIDAEYNGQNLTALGDDELNAYKALLWAINDSLVLQYDRPYGTILNADCKPIHRSHRFIIVNFDNGW